MEQPLTTTKPKHSNKNIKIIAISITLILTILSIAFLTFIYLYSGSKDAQGYVYDCKTNKPIENAKVSLIYIGWGLSENKQLIWDKRFSYDAITNADGMFKVSYKKSPTKIQSRKKGYLIAEQHQYPNKEIIIKMLKGNETSYSNYCRLSTECLQTTVENGVTSAKNICNSYEE